MPASSIALTCVGCNAALAPGDIDLARATARCPRCGAEHQLQVRLMHDDDDVPGWRPELPESGLDPAPAAAVVRTAEVQAEETGPIRVPVPRGAPPSPPSSAAGPARADPADTTFDERDEQFPAVAARWLESLRTRLGDAVERIEAVGVRRWITHHALAWPAFPTGMPGPATALQVREDEHGLQLEWGWFGLPAVALMMGTAVFATWIAGWAAATVLLPGTVLGAFAVLGGVVHLAVTLGLTYVAAAGLLDRTRVRATAGALDVWHGPIPWPGPRRIPTGRISALEVARRAVRGRDGTVELYDVIAVLAGVPTRRLPVARGAWSREAAEALARSVERALGLGRAPATRREDAAGS